MKNQKKQTKKQNEKKTARSKTNKRLLGIGQKLGIVIPAGLLLLGNFGADAAAWNHPVTENANTAREAEKLQQNEVAKHLLGLGKEHKVINKAAHDSPLHSDSHINKDSPNVHNNYSDSGKHTNNHLNTHTNTHGDRS